MPTPVIKCPSCGRSGGPFRVGDQARLDNRMVRSWSCPCGYLFYAPVGAEAAVGLQHQYTGFSVEWDGTPMEVRLVRLARSEMVWQFGRFVLQVNTIRGEPRTRRITLREADLDPVRELRVDPSWGIAELLRRLRSLPLPPNLPAELLARILIRVLA